MEGAGRGAGGIVERSIIIIKSPTGVPFSPERCWVRSPSEMGLFWWGERDGSGGGNGLGNGWSG